jgi:hypothetical protein
MNTWILFVNVETKEQSKQWIHTHSPNKPEELLKNYLPEELVAITAPQQ